MKLRSIIRGDDRHRSCLKKCRHCGILFLTDRRNAGRTDLFCPFGCRTCHQKEQSRLRSREYYQSPEGRIKKKELNMRRRKDRLVESARSFPDHRSLLIYLQIVACIIEGRFVDLGEITLLLKELVRQHRFENGKDLMYLIFHEDEIPP